MAAHEDPRRAQTESPRRRSMELVFAGKPARCRADQSRIRAALRNHGAQPYGPRGVQLFGAGPAECGSARPVWQAGTRRAMADAAAGTRDQVVWRDEGNTAPFR